MLGFNDACLDIDHDETFDNAVVDPVDDPLVLSSALTFSGSRLDCATTFEQEAGDLFTLSDFWSVLQSDNTMGTVDLTGPHNMTTPNLTPTAGSGLETGGTTPNDAFFDPVSYRGAFAPGSDWTSGWTTFEGDYCDTAADGDARCGG